MESFAKGLESHGLLQKGRVIKTVEGKYTIEEKIAKGGSGEVYRASGSYGDVAIKLYAPELGASLFDTQEATTQRWEAARLATTQQFQEHDSLSTLDHPNVVRVLDSGTVAVTKSDLKRMQYPDNFHDFPFVVMEFIRGRDLKGVLDADERTSADSLVRVLIGVSAALDYVHSQRRMHCDVRAKNIMIRASDGSPVLVDFAQSKNFNFGESLSRDGKTLLLVDRATLPESRLLEQFIATGEKGTLTRHQIYQDSFPTLDHVQFGRMLGELIDVAGASFTNADLNYLKLAALRLQQWGPTKWVGPLHDKIGRIGGRGFEAERVPELREPSGDDRTLTLPGSARVPLEGFVKPVIETRSFRRLGTIQQLSLLSEVYPAATYTRSVHALYTYHHTRLLATRLIDTPAFRLIMDAEAVRTLLLVSLLHDINHFPFLHTVQEADLPGLSNASVIEMFCQGGATGEAHAGEKSLEDLMGDVGLSLERFSRLAYGDPVDQMGDQDRLINSIVSSGADIDKISYLMSDSYFTGVTYGAGIDLNELLASSLAVTNAKGRIHLGYKERALQAVENLYLTRYWNFRTIYWHHTNRALMSMVLHTVRSLYEGPHGNAMDYVAATKWSGDRQATQWLDEQHRQVLGRPSILNGVIESRTAIFKRLYTVHPAPGSADQELFKLINGLIGQKGALKEELELRGAVARSLSSLIGIDCTVDDILFDVPRRGGLNSPGDAYIQTDEGVKSIEELSPSVKHLREHYQQLSERVRVYMSPRAAAAAGPGFRLRRRDEVRDVLMNACLGFRGPAEGVS